MSKVKVRSSFAYYLPQFHSFKENNEWWGENFTEWTHLRAAKKFSKNHEIYYPHEDLGYYRLENIEVMEKQYQMAQKSGIDCFCFWNYWFGNEEKLMEKPLEDLLGSSISIKYCVAWANHSWFNKSKNLLLKEQKYPGLEDINKHFDYLSRFFLDSRYKLIDNKPVLFIFKPSDIPYLNLFKEVFDKRCIELGFSGVYIVAENSRAYNDTSRFTDRCVNSRDIITANLVVRAFRLIRRNIAKFYELNPISYDYRKRSKHFNNLSSHKEVPVIIPGWDSSIRHGRGGWYFNNNTLEAFKSHVNDVKDLLDDRNLEDRIFVVKSWNEWAEGNFIEPDSKRGYSLLEVMENAFQVVKHEGDS